MKFKRNDIVIRVSDKQKMIIKTPGNEMSLCQWNDTRLKSELVKNSDLKVVGQNPRIIHL